MRKSLLASGMSRWGISLPIHGLALAEHPALLRELFDGGYTDAWSQEVAGYDAFVPLAMAAIAEPRMRVGTAIAAALTRGPALLAMSAAALAGLAPGRFVLGIGASSPNIVSGWNGLPYARPLTRMRDQLRFLRAALAGERVDADFESFSIRGFALERAPEEIPPIHLAGLRERMLELAREQADGAILSMVSPEEVERLVRQGLIGASEHDVVLRVGVIAVEDPDRAREIAKRTLAAYLNVPAYRAQRRWLGGADALEPMWQAWQAGDRAGACEAVPDALADALFVHGTPAACRDQLRRFVDAGVRTPIVALLASDREPVEVVKALAPDSR